MTTRFESKEAALGMGLFYAGSKQKIQDLKVNSTEKIGSPFDIDDDNEIRDLRDLEVYEIIGEKGKVKIGIEKSTSSDGKYDEYYLWLIMPNGISLRA